MKNDKVKLLACFIVCLSLITALGCGKDNRKSPYEAPDGSTISDVDDLDVNSGGGGGMVTYLVWVRDKDGKPLNDMDIGIYFFTRETISSWAWIIGYNNGDLIDEDDVEYWDDEGFPHVTTDEHGESKIDIFIPFGFAGQMDVVFDIYSASTQSTITVNPAGGQCFDGKDNDSDGGIDAGDPDCTGPGDMTEAAASI